MHCQEGGETGTDSMVILDPNWLTRLMATLITSKPNFVKYVYFVSIAKYLRKRREGILHTRNLDLVWRPPDFPRYVHSILLSLLQKYELALPFPTKRATF